MKHLLTFSLVVTALAFAAPGERSLHAEEPSSTSRHVHGIITTVDKGQMTIASMQSAVSGKLDPKKTRVTVNGKAASIADLKLTAHARGELGLDDVWSVVESH
ncbi:MAG: hypothetical protein U0183_31075 [Polyangiaceae bacterium]